MQLPPNTADSVVVTLILSAEHARYNTLFFIVLFLERNTIDLHEKWKDNDTKENE